MNNQECKVTTEIVSVNSNKPLFYPFSIKTSKCSCSCNNINDSYATLCVPDVKQVSAVVVVTILMIPMQHCVFLMLLKM